VQAQARRQLSWQLRGFLIASMLWCRGVGGPTSLAPH
jgi:hypothetical protein